MADLVNLVGNCWIIERGVCTWADRDLEKSAGGGANIFPGRMDPCFWPVAGYFNPGQTGGNVTNLPQIIDVSCEWVLIYISRNDVLTDGMARQILNHNETVEKNCSKL